MMDTKKRNEFSQRFRTDPAYRALIRASRQLELCGWCPLAKRGKQNDAYDCDTARQDGVTGCHICITEHFSIWAHDPLRRAGNTDKVKH